MTTKKKPTHHNAHEETADHSTGSLKDVRSTRAEAWAALVVLKQADPRDADDVLAQKLVVQKLDAEIRDREAAGESE